MSWMQLEALARGEVERLVGEFDARSESLKEAQNELLAAQVRDNGIFHSEQLCSCGSQRNAKAPGTRIRNISQIKYGGT